MGAPVAPTSHHELLGAAAHAENTRWAVPGGSPAVPVYEGWPFPVVFGTPSPVPLLVTRRGAPQTAPVFPAFPGFVLEGFPGALISLEKRHLRQQRQLLLPSLAHPHRCFRDPGTGWLGAAVLMPSLTTSYSWFVSPGEEG